MGSYNTQNGCTRPAALAWGRQRVMTRWCLRFLREGHVGAASIDFNSGKQYGCHGAAPKVGGRGEIGGWEDRSCGNRLRRTTNESSNRSQSGLWNSGALHEHSPYYPRGAAHGSSAARAAGAGERGGSLGASGARYRLRWAGSPGVFHSLDARRYPVWLERALLMRRRCAA